MEYIPHGWVIWLTGVPAAGKTTLAQALRQLLRERGVDAVVLDSDVLRRLLTPHPTYSDAERDALYAQLVELAVWHARAGENVIIAATGHRRRYRDAARARLPRFAEVWVRCPADVCRGRDPKKLYKAVASGAIRGLPGVDLPYEPPTAPELVVDTDRQTPDESAVLVAARLPFLQPAPEQREVCR
ncbi:MAG: hypothetical protein RLZZ387_607 [Chloroflexota bacterium]|jgi:adenylylsulfate kinase